MAEHPGPLLGAAWSATQAEGAALASDWFAHERAGAAPPSLDGNGTASDLAADARQLAEAGLDLVRVGVDWSRIEPAEGRVDRAALDTYRERLAAIRSAGLTVWVTLADGVLPGWFSVDLHGWRDRTARSLVWPRHVERCADTFGDLVDGWAPVTDVVAAARAAFLVGTAPPAVRSPQKFVESVRGGHLAALEAWRVLRGGGAPVAACYEVAVVRPADERVTSTNRARALEETLWCWTEGFRDGVLHLRRLPPVAVPAMRDAFDVIGLLPQGELVVDGDGSLRRRSSPEDLLATLHRAAEEGPDRPLMVLGHTVAHGAADDPADLEALDATLAQLDTAVRDGIDVRAWLWEPAIDGYAVAAADLLAGTDGRVGFGPRLGLLDRSRTMRPTGVALGARARAARQLRER